MAFQDFDLIQERRKQVRAQQFKKRITIALVSIIVILLIAAAAVCVVYCEGKLSGQSSKTSETDHNKSPSTPTARKSAPEKEKQSPPKPAEKPSPASPPAKTPAPAPAPAPGPGPAKSPSPSPSPSSSPAPAPGPASTPAPAPGPASTPAPAPGPVADNVVKAACASTDYPDICETALKANATGSEPKEFIKATISATNDSVDKAITAVNDIKVDDPFKKSALNDCITLLNDAKDELNTSASSMNATEMEKLKPELNNWLSAVISYQQTCIDGLPDGDEKNSVIKALQNSTQQTSNSLAMVTQATSSPLSGASIKRRLLGKRSLLNVVGTEDEFPSWVDQGRRRYLKADLPTQTPNATVAKDGSGNFTTISDALNAIPQSYEGRYYIFVKEGLYAENVVVTKRMQNVTLYGVGSQKSVITGNKNIVDGVPTYQTATFVAEGDGFMAQSLGFKNTAGPEKHEAVALRVKADRSIFLNCRMEGYQSTIFAQAHRQFYRSCYITGTINIIFGDASAVFQNCDIYLRKPLDNQQNIVTSQTRVDKRESTGFVLQNCHVLADDQLEGEKGIKSYLGRPLTNYSRVIVMESEIGDVIDPEGYISQNDIGISTCYYAEFNNKGPKADVNARVKWEGIKKGVTKEEALNFTVGPFIQAEGWLKDGHVPVRFGLFN